MPRISTDNYDTVASWNGSQDLLIVEQPDGTKVATPALLKQYVLAGVTETSEQYAECSTARNVTAKTVTLPGFELETGARISVRFTDTGTSNPASGNLTLNVNGTGAKEIVDSHTDKTKLTYTSGGLFYNNIVNDFIYDGTYWVYMNRDNNTTYTSKTAASGGTATSLCTTGEKYTWNNKQSALTFDNVPTQNSNNPVKSGGIYSKIGDLTQTGLTGDSVAAQLESIKNAITFDKVPDSFITLQSGISIVTNQVYKQGNHVFGWITFSFSAQTPSALKLGVLNSGYRPSGISRMMVGLGTQPWTSEYVGYCLRDSDYSLGVTGYNANIRAAHIHLDYVV